MHRRVIGLSSGRSALQSIVVAFIGSLVLVSSNAFAVVAPGVDDEAVFTGRLRGAGQPWMPLDQSARFAPPLDAAALWASAAGARLSLDNAISYVPGGGQPQSVTTSSLTARPGGFGWSTTEFVRQTNTWFGAAESLSSTPLLRASGPQYYQQTYSFLAGSVYQSSMIARPADGLWTQTSFFIQSVTFNYNPVLPGAQLPPVVAAVPEGEGLVLLLAGWGVFAVARRAARSRRAHEPQWSFAASSASADR